jgi:hypothetical protein
MAQQKVELRKVRDFTDNLNDTFLFIRQNLKPLIAAFLGIAGVFLLTAAIVNGVYQSQTTGNLFKQIFTGRVEANESISYFGWYYVLVVLFAWLNYNAMTVVVIAYMKLYEQNGGIAPTVEDVWREFRQHFLTVAFYTIPIFLLIVVGMILCLVPGIYLAVVLAPFPIILAIENESFGGAFNRCFTIIKENFWVSFGIYAVMYLIYYFSAAIISVMVSVFAGLISYFTTKNINTTVGVVSSILNIFSFVFFIVFYVSVVLQYYNLTERYDGTGILRRLDSMGENTGGHTNAIEEEY